jgi:ABC-type polar amino acid transport system ATPase subunit
MITGHNSSEAPIIQVQDLHLTYNKGKANELHVIKGMSFSVNKGEVICIIGPSGTGKSSLIRCLNGLAIPTSGSVVINGVDIQSKETNIQRVRQDIGFVFQHFELFPHMSVLDNVSLHLRKVKGISKKEANKRALDALTLVGLADKASTTKIGVDKHGREHPRKIQTYPANLSGGQRQRVAIARALAQDPKIILFDEPTSALDPELIGEVLKVMEDIARLGMTMLIVTHELDFARSVCSRVFYLDQGKIWEQGEPTSVFLHPREERTRAFLAASHMSLQDEYVQTPKPAREGAARVIDVKDLYLTYNQGQPGELRVIKGMSFTVYTGDVVCILGPSGTGKSSLIRCLNGLTVPTYGDVTINGKNIYQSGVDIYKVRQDIGFVFQNFELFPHMSVIDNVSLSLRKVRSMPTATARNKALEALQCVGLEDKVYSHPADLSGGQKQRVAIARALAQDPTSALDPQLIGEVLAVMESIARMGMTMIVVTHELDFARRVANRVFFLDQGTIWEQGPPEQVLVHPRMERTWQFLNASQVLRGQERQSAFGTPNLDTKAINARYSKMQPLMDESKRFKRAGDLGHASLWLGVSLVIPFFTWILTGPLAIGYGVATLATKPRSPAASLKAKYGIGSGIAQIILFFVMLWVLCMVFPAFCGF